LSGHNQHFIPQFFIKEFGWKQKKKTYVNVHDREKVFISPTDNVGAMRHFYSKPMEGENDTLDDIITDFEDTLSRVYRRIKETPFHEQVISTDAAVFVTHMCIRQDLARRSFVLGGQMLLDKIDKLFQNPEKIRDYMGLNKSSPQGLVLEELEGLYKKLKLKNPNFVQTKDQFIHFAYPLFQNKFTEEASSLNEMIGASMFEMKNKIHESASAGHKKALLENLVPSKWIEGLEQLSWKTHDYSGEEVILPDCVAVNAANGKADPLFYADKSRLGIVVLPLTPSKVLIGAKEYNEAPPFRRVNRTLSKCCWNFFVSRERTNELDNFRKNIGTYVEKKIKNMVNVQSKF
jgi:Protein of unknown function (DUF4238)